MQENTKTYHKIPSISQIAEIAVDYSTATHSDTLSKEDVLNSIEEFSQLENNWDGYDAIPLILDSAKNAKQLISTLPEEHFANFYDGFPNTHGTISFEWKNKREEEFFIEIGDSKMSYFLTLNNQKPIKKDLVDFNLENIKTIKSYIQKLNASI
jgi:hypothetical protein